MERHGNGVIRALLSTGSFIVLLVLASASPARADTSDGRDLGAATDVLAQATSPLTGSPRDTVGDLGGVVDQVVSGTAERIRDTVRRAADTMSEPVHLVGPVVQKVHETTEPAGSPGTPARTEERRTTAPDADEAREVDGRRDVVRKQGAGAPAFPIKPMRPTLAGAPQRAVQERDERRPEKGSSALLPKVTSSFSRAFDQLGSSAAVLAVLTALSILFPRGFGLSEGASARTRSHTSGIPPG